VREMTEADRPVLIGTRTVSESEQISRMLEQAQVSCRVLNAAQDQHEADIVADAGQPGSILVATNMAGRGTDIALHETVRAAGGLHVISTQLNDSARVDRQLSGRCARQGDPGSHEMLLSLEDEIFCTMLPAGVRERLMDFANPENGLWRRLTPVLLTAIQRTRDAQLKHQRQAVRRADRHMEDLLAFGRHE
jgi:preprotein translocase subunit SecA